MITTPDATPEISAQIAASNRELFARRGVTVISLVGPTGTGKTSVIESIARKLQASARVAAIVGNAAALRNSERLSQLGLPTVAIETDHLTPYDIGQAIAEIDLDATDLLLIEHTGDKLPADQFDLGQNMSIAVFSTAGGDERAAEHSRLILQSDMVLLTKIDLLPLVEFDVDMFTNDIAKLHPLIEVLHISGRNGVGVSALVNWIALRTSSSGAFSNYHPAQRLAWFHGGELA